VVDALGRRNASLPNWVRIGPLMQRSNGTVLHGQLPGFLGKQHAPFSIDQALLGEDVKIQAIQPAEGLTTARLTRRKQLRDEFSAFRRIIDIAGETEAFDSSYQRALNLLSSDKTQRAFELGNEPAELRDRYGKTEFGQRCLLARRLAEAGVPMVNVSYCQTPSGSWDTHGKHFTSMKNSLAPTLDAAFSTLIEDLDERGRLDDTLVIVTAEFGRTPKINSNAGRDHWPNVYSIALAGAGVRAGTVHGASDNAAAFPTESPHDPKDFAATLYHLLGIPADTVVYDTSQRPHHLVIGKPIEGILA
jgi:membrane-anchored protein YejM (alkaline phosphatase superfamily)